VEIKKSLAEVGLTSEVAAEVSRAGRITEALSGPLRLVPVFISLAVIWIVFDTQNSVYLSLSNLTNLTLQIVTTSILALGLVFVLLVGEIDLSVAALSGVSATIAARMAVEVGAPLGIAILIAIAAAVLVTFVESLAIVFGVPSLIVTLGGMIILQGMILIVLPPSFQVSVGGTSFANIAGTQISPRISYTVAVLGSFVVLGLRLRRYSSSTEKLPKSFLRIVLVPSLSIAIVLISVVAVLSPGGGLPLPVVILTFMLIAGSYITTQTRLGNHIYAVGGNRQAAQRAGIPVRRVVIYTFLLLGVCGAAGGIIEASRLLSVSPSSGSGPLMLNAIAAAVVGGTSLFGGRGTVWAALLGSLVIGSINNGVQLLGLSTQVQYIATGVVLVAAVGIDVIITRGSFWPSSR
jgi:D-xylose transport system permease protein